MGGGGGVVIKSRIYGCLVVRSRNVWWMDLRVSGGQI